MFKFSNSLYFYLSDPLPCHIKLLPKFLKSMGNIFANSVSLSNNLRLLGVKGAEHLFYLEFKIIINCDVKGGKCRFVFNKVPKMTVLLFSYGSLKRYGLLSDLLYCLH